MGESSRSESPTDFDKLSSKTMKRQVHAELLLFELVCWVEHEFGHLTEGAALETTQASRVRYLYKSLAHGRRPDGTKY